MGTDCGQLNNPLPADRVAVAQPPVVQGDIVMRRVGIVLAGAAGRPTSRAVCPGKSRQAIS